MSRKRSEQPAYQYHASGQARVRLDSVEFYLGKHGTPESYARYYALLAEYNANGKRAPSKTKSGQDNTRQGDDAIRIKHVTADFRVKVLPQYARSPNR